MSRISNKFFVRKTTYQMCTKNWCCLYIACCATWFCLPFVCMCCFWEHPRLVISNLRRNNDIFKHNKDHIHKNYTYSSVQTQRTKAVNLKQYTILCSNVFIGRNKKKVADSSHMWNASTTCIQCATGFSCLSYFKPNELFGENYIILQY